ncbi:hypothetical protein BDF19DRAFT_411204 [Syncephalis fuscata]|nr:hypothetical protein BDF19DRAFT_411204 [Syncephalis fuscata]
MPAPVDIILSQKKQQQEELCQVSQGSLARDSAFDFYDFTPTLLDASESSSDDDYYPHDLEANFCRDFSTTKSATYVLKKKTQLPWAMLIMLWMTGRLASDESRPGSPSPVRDTLMARQFNAAAALKRQPLSATAAAAAMSGVNLNDVLSQQTAAMELDIMDHMDVNLMGRKRTASSMTSLDAFNGMTNKRMAMGAIPVPQSPPMQQQTFVDDELLLAALLQIGSGNIGTEEMLQDALLLQQQLLLNGRSTSLATATSAAMMANGQSASLNANIAASSAIARVNAGSNVVASSSTTGAACTTLVDRPYRCAVPGCEKSYKNANGLKYHNLHGHCNGTASAASGSHNVTHNGNGADGALANATRGVQVKPYRCTIPECGKSYKNLNGLKYHVEHAHPGAVALPLGKKAHVKAAATVIAQAQERLQMPVLRP